MTPRHLLAPARLAGSRLLATQSDERLVDLVRAGSEPAYEAVVSRYRGPLLRYCSALLGRERAEDAVQQTFLNAYEAMRRDDRPLRLKPWLYRIAHNTAHNVLRSRALRDEPLGDESAEAERPELVLERRERLRAVLASVQGLPDRQRDALVLRELEGRSYEEIAAALGADGGAVRQLLNRARTTLRTAATAITPPALLLRMPGGGESVAARVAELTGAAGTGAVAAKVAATALVTGAVAGGAAVVPLDDYGDRAPDRPARDAAPNARPAPAAASPAAPALPLSVEVGADGRTGGSADDRDDDDDRSGPGDGDGGGDSSGPGPGGDDGDGDSGDSNSGPGSSSSGPGPSGSGDDSGSSGPSGSSGSGSSGSGTSGSSTSGSGSGTSGSGSGTSGSDSGTSSSGTSGSGSSGWDSSTSASGSSDSGSDASGSTG